MEQENRNDKGKRKAGPRISKKKLDSFLASICEAAGMTGKAPRKKEASSGRKGLTCQGPCQEAEWRSHLDVPYGILCVSADWSKNKHAEKHRDVVVALSYVNDEGKTDYSEMVLCDSEIRWLMEALWHAPIWE